MLKLGYAIFALVYMIVNAWGMVHVYYVSARCNYSVLMVHGVRGYWVYILDALWGYWVWGYWVCVLGVEKTFFFFYGTRGKRVLSVYIRCPENVFMMHRLRGYWVSILDVLWGYWVRGCWVCKLGVGKMFLWYMV